MHVLIVALLAVGFTGPAHAQVRIDIGIQLPAPPRLVVVPEVRAVQYVPAPAAPANLFFYGGQYWAFVNNGWHVSAGYNGPWVVVGPTVVPRPLLLVPVQYYPVPPGHWKQWHKHSAPRWGDEWGPEWARKRGWKERDHDRDHRDDDRGKGKGHGHGKGK